MVQLNSKRKCDNLGREAHKIKVSEIEAINSKQTLYIQVEQLLVCEQTISQETLTSLEKQNVSPWKEMLTSLEKQKICHTLKSVKKSKGIDKFVRGGGWCTIFMIKNYMITR